MKCPKCGQEMYSMGNGGFDTARGNYIDTKYVCPGCGCEVKTTTDGNGMGMIRNFVPEYHYGDYGWICPKCGAVLSPSTQECPYCTPHKLTCGTIGEPPIKTVPFSNDITSQAQVLHTPPTPPDNITVTGNCDLTSQPQAETMVSK